MVKSNVVEILPTPTEIMPPSLKDYAAFRSIPPLTMRPIAVKLKGKSFQESHLEDMSPEMPGMELVTTMATRTGKGRTTHTATNILLNTKTIYPPSSY